MALMLLEVKTLVACRMSIVACVMYSTRSPASGRSVVSSFGCLVYMYLAQR